MSISDLLDRPIAYHRVFVDLTGSVKAAILLSQAIYWQKRAKQADGWWYKTADEWEDETGLTRREQEKARKDSEKYLKTKLKDAPARLYWKIDESALYDALISLLGETAINEKVKLESPKSETINKNTETTTENTSYDRKAGMQEAKERKAKQQASKKDVLDFLQENIPASQELIVMRTRVENALHRNLDWDSVRSPWNGYEKKLIAREKETGETIERFMEWFNQDDFRCKGVIYLNPIKIDDWWQQAFGNNGHIPGVDPSAEDFPTL